MVVGRLLPLSHILVEDQKNEISMDLGGRVDIWILIGVELFGTITWDEDAQ